VRGWIEWFTQGLWKRRRPIIAWTLFTVFIIGIAFLRVYDFAGRPPRTIHDASFERRAVAICEKEIPKLRAVKREEKTDDPLETETADKVDQVADDLEAMVSRLQALEVRSADRAAVQAWFGSYADFIAAGRHYAEALRGGNEDVYEKVDDEGVEPLKRVRDFARANHIDACIP
jgi:hypothetical protein